MKDKKRDNNEKQPILEQPILEKIEIDEKTAEPFLVETVGEEISDGTADLNESKADREEISDNASTDENKKPESEQLKMDLKFASDREVSKRQRILKAIITIVFAIFVVAVIAYTAYEDFFANTQEMVTWDYVVQTLSNSWFYIIFALIALGFCFLLKGLKMSIMCHATTGKMHFKLCMETAALGHYYNYITPLAIGGQPFEIYNLNKGGVKSGSATSIPIAAFFMGQFAFVALTVVALVFDAGNILGAPHTITVDFPGTTILAYIGLFFGLLMPFIVVLFSLLPKAGGAIVNFVINIGGKLKIIKYPETTKKNALATVQNNSDCLKHIASNKLTLLLSFLIGIAEQLAMCSIAYFSLRFFGYDIPARGILEWLQIVETCLILYASVSFIPTPGNSGAADFSFFWIFKIGLVVGLAFPAMACWRILSFYSFLLVGFCITIAKKRKAKAALAKETNF